MRPEFKILRPEISPCKFPVARAQPGLKLQAQNPTRTMKKVAWPSPTDNVGDFAVDNAQAGDIFSVDIDCSHKK